jgi:hypothetical protein
VLLVSIVAKITVAVSQDEERFPARRAAEKDQLLLLPCLIAIAI